MTYTFQHLRLPPEEDLVLARAGRSAWLDVELVFRQEETDLEPVVRLRVPVAYSGERSLDQLHGEAVREAEDLAQLAATHLEENDVGALVRMAMGS
ncbi:hypothetical protein [Thiohalorhabdus methylotrophus]|uniref:Uncharacterized protein n=1 Tax=Thiohalorhabdus methylotrophus TaxID=3242694 RepID=A0ABV4TRJ4_9GAMM